MAYRLTDSLIEQITFEFDFERRVVVAHGPPRTDILGVVTDRLAPEDMFEFANDFFDRRSKEHDGKGYRYRRQTVLVHDGGTEAWIHTETFYRHVARYLQTAIDALTRAGDPVSRESWWTSLQVVVDLIDWNHREHEPEDEAEEGGLPFS
jgi:hypothetical protein